ncbi:MAG: hypothetical protein ABH821_02450, partial [archaeon]
TDNLKTNFVLRMVKLNNGFYHLWSHEYNLSSEKELGFLERIFKQVNSLGLEKNFMKDIKSD